MGLYDTQNDFKEYAAHLPMIEVNGKHTNKYEAYSINVLADGYCKALDENDEENINIYLSALMLRFWYVIDKIYQSVKQYGFDYDDCFNRLYDCIQVACKYRAWQNPDKHTNAQACINMAIKDRGAAMMAYEATLQKAGVHAALTLDDELDDESNSTKADLVADEHPSQFSQEVYGMIQELLSKNLITEAIIADNVAYNDCERVEKKTVVEVDEDGNEFKYKEQSREFWSFQLVKELNALDDDYIDYFSKIYGVEIELLTNAVNSLVKYPNQKKYKIIEKSFETMRALFVK